MKIERCPINGENNGTEYLNLGNVPLVNNLCETREDSFNCEKFPLAIQFFSESKLTCLTEVINKDDLFLNYLYRSGVNKPYLDHCSRMYDYLSHMIDFKDKDLIADIGGNDGSLLIEFRKENRNLHYVNIDCSKSFVDINNEAGIEYVNEYFYGDTQLPYKAKLITSTNVFQHTEPIRSFVKGIERNLSNEGIWCLEFPYILTTLANDNYDEYLKTGDRSKLDKTKRYDLFSGISLAAFQAGLAGLIYFLLIYCQVPSLSIRNLDQVRPQISKH
jgi:hypothetical protein